MTKKRLGKSDTFARERVVIHFCVHYEKVMGLVAIRKLIFLNFRNGKYFEKFEDLTGSVDSCQNVNKHVSEIKQIGSPLALAGSIISNFESPQLISQESFLVF